MATTTRVYFSRNSLLDAGDTPLGAAGVPALAPGTLQDATVTATLPPDLAPGYYYVIAKADADGVESETQESNNATARLVTVGPDLVVSALSAPASAGAGSVVALAITVKNQGGGAAAASLARFYLSANALWETTDTPLPGGFETPSLAPGSTATGTASVTIPAGTAAGSFYVIAKADGDGAVVETQEGNNAAARLVQVGGDLVVTAVGGPSKAAAGASITVTDTTKNSGAGSVAASVTRFYLSANALFDAADVPLAGGRPVPALAPGATSSGSATVVLPGGLAAGTWYVIAKADGDGLVAETVETNNALSRSLVLGSGSRRVGNDRALQRPRRRRVRRRRHGARTRAGMPRARRRRGSTCRRTSRSTGRTCSWARAARCLVSPRAVRAPEPPA